MPAPGSLLDLALTLHPAQPAADQDRQALLASRLGYAEVWLPVDTGLGLPGPARLDTLAAAAGATRLGLVFSGPAATVIGGLRRLAAAPPAGVLIELAAGIGGPAFVQAVGGPAAWRERVRLPAFDPAAAGTVVCAPTRADSLTGIAVAAAQRAAAGLTAAEHPVIAALPASIGRTWNEAEARAGRDPRFAAGAVGTGAPGTAAGGVAGDPRLSGLFGTYEQAQAQVLELAAAGADGLRLTVPDEVDVADLLAQVRSVVVGATPVLHARRG